MLMKTEQSVKLTEFIEYLEVNVLDYTDIAFLEEVQKRLDELERAIIKMDSAFHTNHLIGDETVRAIVKTLLDSRK